MWGVQALRRDRTKASDATRVWGQIDFDRGKPARRCVLTGARPFRSRIPARGSNATALGEQSEHLGNGLAPVLGKRTLVAYPPIELSKSSEMTSAPNST